MSTSMKNRFSGKNEGARSRTTWALYITVDWLPKG